MSNHPVTSREYKLMLNVDRFFHRDAGMEGFWRLVGFLVKKQGGEVEKQNDPEEKRRTWYLDTLGADLTRNHFILRVREDRKNDDKEYKITLKYRSPDRYLSAAQDVSSADAGETKFEEDITPPFTSKFSFSTSIKRDRLPDFQTINDAVARFPGLDKLNVPGATPLEIVNHFQAHEVACKRGKLKFGEHKVKAAFSFWYLLGAENELPIVGEFSFDYDALENNSPDSTKLEQFPVTLVSATNRFFLSLQNQTGWLNCNATTKTAFALESL